MHVTSSSTVVWQVSLYESLLCTCAGQLQCTVLNIRPTSNNRLTSEHCQQKTLQSARCSKMVHSVTAHCAVFPQAHHSKAHPESCAVHVHSRQANVQVARCQETVALCNTICPASYPLQTHDSGSPSKRLTAAAAAALHLPAPCNTKTDLNSDVNKVRCMSLLHILIILERMLKENVACHT
jgi:hypothetical protein